MFDKIWNKIVECCNLYINSPEKKIQCLWENIFAELLGYSRLNGDIDSFRSMQIGSLKRIIIPLQKLSKLKIQRSAPSNKLYPLISISISVS